MVRRVSIALYNRTQNLASFLNPLNPLNLS